MICRIFHKNGEKKNGVNNALGVGQSYMLEVCSSSTTTSTSLQNNNTFVIQRQEENDLKLKSLINHVHVISQSLLIDQWSVLSEILKIMVSSKGPLIHNRSALQVAVAMYTVTGLCGGLDPWNIRSER